MLLAQSADHVEVGAFADYYRQSDPSNPPINFIGLGGRAGFNVRPSIQMEAEMAYDFRRNYTNTFTNGVTTTDVPSKLRVLHGFFGPKFQTGAGPFRVFLTGKVGFDNFNVTTQNAPTGFSNSVGLTNGATYFAVYREEDLRLSPGLLEFVPRQAMTYSSITGRIIISELRSVLSFAFNAAA